MIARCTVKSSINVLPYNSSSLSLNSHSVLLHEFPIRGDHYDSVDAHTSNKNKYREYESKYLMLFCFHRLQCDNDSGFFLIAPYDGDVQHDYGS